MSSNSWNWLHEFRKLWEAPSSEPSRHSGRVLKFQRSLVVPAKLVVLATLLYSLIIANWMPHIAELMAGLPVLLKATTAFYTMLTVVFAVVLFVARNFSRRAARWLVLGVGLLDGVYLALLTLAMGGFESALFWVFFGLIIINALSLPLSISQIVLNLLLSALYMAAGIGSADIVMANSPVESALPLGSVSAFLAQLIVLWLLTACCYGVQVLAARRRQAEEESREFAARQGQLRTAGRLAAEIAHQVKNPLAIINNATFSLRRALANGKTDVSQHLQIIQEEIERSDRIITQLMGYARLAEGQVERVKVIEELDRALEEVFPTAVGYDVQIHRDYATNLPALVMQRGHLNTILVNLLQNAREAIEGHGNIYLSTRLKEGNSVMITIQDDGPGIPAEQSERIFEAYFTTKDKGTGLGLAIVKHDVDLYSGSIHVESELGKGAKFVLVFPAKALSDPTKDA